MYYDGSGSSSQERFNLRAIDHVGRSVDLSYHQPLPESKRGAMKVTCLECSRNFLTRSYIPTCPGCGGSDIELA